MARWSPGSTVVVLGAGASRGAEFVEKGRPRCLPPLNADFFTQLQRINTVRHQDTVKSVLDDVLTLHGPNFALTLEQYFTQLEAMIAMVRLSKHESGKLGLDDLQKMRTNLLEALSAVLEESADVAKQKSPARKTPCSYHASLVRALKPKDTIISFNYDCLIDHALRLFGDGKWSAQYGYGFPTPSRVKGYDVWNAPSAPTAQNASINLLKLHGSLNWFPFPADARRSIRLREKPYKQHGQKLYEIVPPEYVKTVGTRPIFPVLWSHAELALRRVKVLAFIGFSFTPTDLHVEAMFRLALAEAAELKRVIIVNPSREHRQRIRSVLSRALAKGAPVVQFETLAHVAPYFEDALTP
jgi:hypothetical protein